MFNRALVFALVCMAPGVAFGQIICPGGACPPIVQYAPQAMQAAPVQLQTPEAAAVVADWPHVRCIAGNSCGSGTICGADADGAFVVTNAHVAGTALGRAVSVDCVVDGAGKRVTGRTVMAGYSDSRMVDFCIIYVPGLTSKRYMPMLKTEPVAQPFGTTGSPRCVWPQVTKSFSDPRNYGDGLLTGTPNAIGGQSGSAIYNADKHQIALLTWSINGRCAGQKTSKLWQVATSRNVQLADPRPEGLIELCERPDDRPETQSGIFGQCALFELAEGTRPITQNIIANVVGSAMEDMPIWVTPGKPDPEPEPEPCPECPDCPKCIELTPGERALIDLIRGQGEAAGIQESDWRAIDWGALMVQLFEIIRIIREGLAK